MPNLNDIMEMAELLETKAVFVTPDRCVTVRNRNASCRKCLEACPVEDALVLGMNKLEFNSAFCVECGACTVVCPTEALAPTKPIDADLAAAVSEACKNAGGHAVVACARVSSHGEGNPEKYAEVPCLGRVEECLLVTAVADGASAVTLVDGTCRTCKYRYTSAGVQDTVDSANSLLEAWGSPVRVERSSEWPREARLYEGDESSFGEALGESRRAFFRRGKEKAKEGAKSTVLKALKHGDKIPTLRERLRVAEDGALPHFEAKRRPNTLDALDRLGAPQEAELFTRLWGRVEIDADACSGCRMCTVFCPTGALRRCNLPFEEAASEEARQAQAREAASGVCTGDDDAAAQAAMGAAVAANPGEAEGAAAGAEIAAEADAAGAGEDVAAGAGAEGAPAPLHEDGQYLEFSAADCVQCDSCADICLQKCLTVDPFVRTDELMDFEPRLIWIPEMQKNNLLGRGLRGKK